MLAGLSHDGEELPDLLGPPPKEVATIDRRGRTEGLDHPSRPIQEFSLVHAVRLDTRVNRTGTGVDG